jgi:hypothetical protein
MHFLHFDASECEFYTLDIPESELGVLMHEKNGQTLQE